MRIIEWKSPADVPLYAEGQSGNCLRHALNLTHTHGEREFLRHAFLWDVNGDGRPEIVTRTMNANRARALRIEDGATLWLSPDIAPPPETAQVSQLGFGDMDADGAPEALLATYQGDVICLDARDGAVKWHRRLPWHINNPRLDMADVTAETGLNVALVVGNDFDWCGPTERRRINFVRRPSLVVLDGRGEQTLLIEEYAGHNAAGHNVWLADVDEDGLAEIAASGDSRLIWFKQDGTELCTLPCTGEESKARAHPDALTTWNWLPDRPGREIVYLDGTDGIIIADHRGEVLMRRLYPKDIASHLQELLVVPTDDGPMLLAENIRAADSKLLCLDRELGIRWAALAPTDLMLPLLMDWDGDGEPEIVCGGHGHGMHNPTGLPECSLHVMKRDGTPLYWHRWPGETLCIPLAVGDMDGDGRDEVLVTVGTPNGPEGRFSLKEGHEQRLFIMSGAR